MKNDWIIKHLSENGMLVVLLLLGLFFSAITFNEQFPEGSSGGRSLAKEISKRFEPGATVLIVVRDTEDDLQFAETARQRLDKNGFKVLDTVRGQPSDAGKALRELDANATRLDVIGCISPTASWTVFDGIPGKMPAIGRPEVVAPPNYYWPDFLKRDNLLNISGQIAIIAIIAIGMTFVIITAGIDLSVGSLIALSSVAAAWLIRASGASQASVPVVILCCILAILLCALIGLFSGTMVTAFEMPPFIVTLAMMLVARGVAELISNSQTINEVPDWFVWLGREASFLGIPNAALLMLLLYGAAYFVLAKTSYGRHVYAVGGNREAARLSGVSVRRIILSVYVMCGALAGIGGIIQASILKSGSHIYGMMDELHVIAAVVVGGTSLAGGVGRITGTLIGALIIGVIRNGMNLLGLGSGWQLVISGSVVLLAVFLDQVKNQRLKLS